MASKERNAPTTLLRLILADGPLTEKEIGRKIVKLAIYSSLLAMVSVVVQYYFFSGFFSK
jgi:UDP-N-acetylglucosamine--dolichyl-phosphate N-acetylglucosaminephosphotransferase